MTIECSRLMVDLQPISFSRIFIFHFHDYATNSWLRWEWHGVHMLFVFFNIERRRKKSALTKLLVWAQFIKNLVSYDIVHIYNRNRKYTKTMKKLGRAIRIFLLLAWTYCKRIVFKCGKLFKMSAVCVGGGDIA